MTEVKLNFEEHSIKIVKHVIELFWLRVQSAARCWFVYIQDGVAVSA